MNLLSQLAPRDLHSNLKRRLNSISLFLLFLGLGRSRNTFDQSAYIQSIELTCSDWDTVFNVPYVWKDLPHQLKVSMLDVRLIVF